MSHARKFIDDLAAGGRYHFAPEEFRASNGLSVAAARVALHRLAKAGLVANPAHGFWVILPPEYRQLGCLPPDQFVPALMEQLGVPYYVALLSAAQYYGAAHHRPQEFQVMVERGKRPLQCGAVRVAFAARRHLARVPTQTFNTPRGTIRVSTVEATAIDLIGYKDHAGGLDNVAGVIAELAPLVDPRHLVKVAQTAPLPWAQRLGYFLDLAGAEAKTGPLERHVKERARNPALLSPCTPRNNAPQDDKWRLILNAEVEVEL